MNTIYVITASGGSYDDVWQSNLFAVEGEERALREIARLEAEHKEAAEIWPQIEKVLHEGYAKMRAFVPELVPPEPKGPKKGTTEELKAHRKIRDAWHDECKPIWERNRVAQNDIYQQGVDAAWLEAQRLSRTADILLHFGRREEPRYAPVFSDADYSYEPLELRQGN